jgi:hypothetical protein
MLDGKLNTPETSKAVEDVTSPKARLFLLLLGHSYR